MINPFKCRLLNIFRGQEISDWCRYILKEKIGSFESNTARRLLQKGITNQLLYELTDRYGDELVFQEVGIYRCESCVYYDLKKAQCDNIMGNKPKNASFCDHYKTVYKGLVQFNVEETSNI